MKEEKPEVIMEYDPSSHFEEELLEFIEEVLSWEEENEHRARTTK